LLPPGVEPAERALKDITHRHGLPPFPPGWMARHRLVQNTHPRPSSSTASVHPELPRSLPSHARSIVHALTRPIFIAMGGAAGPCETLPENLFLKALSEGLRVIRPGAVDICGPMMVR
jgi:hypothetical protein